MTGQVVLDRESSDEGSRRRRVPRALVLAVAVVGAGAAVAVALTIARAAGS